MEELIEQAKNGDEQAFTNIIISIEADLYKIARMRLACEDDINEAVQETIIQTFKSIKKIKKPEFFKTWIIRVLINKCNKVYKKSRNNNYIEYNEAINTSYNNEDESNIRNLDFLLLIKNLNYNERISLILYYQENLTTKEISKLLKEPESTIRNRISRAKAKLKNICMGGMYNE